MTLVRMIPAFWTMIVPPYPAAPEASTLTSGTRRPRRRATGSRTAAARPNRAAVSHPGASQAKASLDSGTVEPHSSPAVTRAATA